LKVAARSRTAGVARIIVGEDDDEDDEDDEDDDEDEDEDDEDKDDSDKNNDDNIVSLGLDGYDTRR
jgi:hypothetical protein